MDTLDINDTTKAFGLSVSLVKYSREFAECKLKAANAKHSVDIMLAAQMPKLSEGRKALGAETAMIMFLGICSETERDIYKDYLTNKARAEGLEKIISALETQISLYQSICKILPK